MKALVLISLLFVNPLWADFAVIDAVKITRFGTGWQFSTMVSHPDEGWDHYADAWEIIGENGTSLGLRILAHPHLTEQPFTRSLTGVQLPEGLAQFYLKVRCSRDGWSEQRFAVKRAAR